MDEVPHGEPGCRHQGSDREQQRQRDGHWPGWDITGVYFSVSVCSNQVMNVSCVPGALPSNQHPGWSLEVQSQEDDQQGLL